MTKINVFYYETKTGGDAEDPSDRWSNRTDLEIDWRIRKVSPNSNDKIWYKEEVEVDFNPIIGKIVYILYARYDSGDTFGRSIGHWYIHGIYETNELAEHNKYLLSIHPKDYSLPWHGYFERLTEITIEHWVLT